MGIPMKHKKLQEIDPKIEIQGLNIRIGIGISICHSLMVSRFAIFGVYIGCIRDIGNIWLIL